MDKIIMISTGQNVYTYDTIKFEQLGCFPIVFQIIILMDITRDQRLLAMAFDDN